jgi:hypothetical protein
METKRTELYGDSTSDCVRARKKRAAAWFARGIAQQQGCRHVEKGVAVDASGQGIGFRVFKRVLEHEV